MFTQNEYALMQVNKDAHTSALNEAKKLRMLRKAGLIKPSRVSVAACKGAACLGRLLISLGQRLERLPLAHPVGAD